MPHKIAARSFYLKYPYQTIDEKFLPKKEKIFQKNIPHIKSPTELNHYLENEEIGGKIRNSNGGIRRDGQYRLQELECLVVGRNYYGQCGFVDDTLQQVEVNIPNYEDRMEGKLFIEPTRGESMILTFHLPPLATAVICVTYNIDRV